MAYVSQELKAKLAPAIKAALKKYGLKGSIGVQNHSTLVINVTKGKLDFFKNYNEFAPHRYGGSEFRKAEKSMQINPHWFKEHFNGVVKEAIEEIMTAANDGNFDKSDVQTDYFHVGWYVDLNIGRWNKPYELIGDAE